MNRVGLLILGGAVLTAGAMVAAARWVPGAMQPAGARAELTRLVVQAVEEVDAMLGTAEEVEPTQLAAEDEVEAAPAVVEDPLPVKVELHGHTDSDCRVHIVMFKSEASWQTESKLARRDLLEKS